MFCSPSLHDIPLPTGIFYFCGLIVTDFPQISKACYYTEMSPFHLLKLVILTGLLKGSFFSQSLLFHNFYTVPSLKAIRSPFFSNSRAPSNFPISSSQNINSPFLHLSQLRKFFIFPSFLRSIFNFFIIQKIYLSFRNAIPTQFFSKNPLNHIKNTLIKPKFFQAEFIPNPFNFMFAPSSYSVSGLSYFFPAVSLPIFYKCSPSFFSKVSASFSLPLNAKNGFHFLTGSGNESIFISSSIFPHLIPDPSPFPCHPFQKCPIQSTSGPIHPLSYPHFIMDFFSINQTFQGPHFFPFFPKAKSFPCLFSYQEGHKMGRISHVLLTFPFYPLLIHPHIPPTLLWLCITLISTNFLLSPSIYPTSLSIQIYPFGLLLKLYQ